MDSTRTTTRRALVAGLTAAVAAAGVGLVLAGPAGAVPGFDLTRLAGNDRFATAAVIARDAFPDPQTVILANGQSDDPSTPQNEDRFADALAATYLAGDLSAPLLLTTTSTLPVATDQALTDLDPTRVVIVGGTAVVSQAQEDALVADGFQVDRVAGPNRYATAAELAREPGSANVGVVGGLRTAVVASGAAFPDALVTGPLAYAASLPLTLTVPTALPAATRDVLLELDIEQVLIPGGTAAVSQAVEDELVDLGIAVERFAGTGRGDTAQLVAEYALRELAFDDTHVNLALGLRFPDALAGGPHAGADRSPILLTAGVDTLGVDARDYLETHDDTLVDGHVFGGTAAVTERVLREAEEAGQGEAQPSPSPSPTSPTPSPTVPPAGPCPAGPTPSDTATATMTVGTSDTPTAVTSRPELASVELVSSAVQNGGTADTRDDFCQTSVRFTFDEQVIGKAPVAARFHLVGFEPTLRYTGRSAVIEASGTSVVVTFGRADDLATTASERQDVGPRQLNDVSIAVVDADAVASNPSSASDSGNPVADRVFGTSRSIPVFPAGITVAPDLVDVTLGTTSAASTVVRYDFDESVARIANANGFHAVTASNRDVTCTSPTASGTQVTAICATGTTDPVVRGYVASDSVSDAATDGNLNVLTAEDVVDNGSAGPDLVSAAFLPGTAANDDDRVEYTFDGPVFVGTAANFIVYQQDGDEIAANSAVRQADATKVIATFPDAQPLLGARTPALPNAVGASTGAGAVIEAGGVNRPNQPDEVSVLNAARTGIIAGLTNGPDLIEVRVDDTMRTATFTFDEVISAADIVFGRLVVTLPGGGRVVCQSGSPTDSGGAPSDAPDSVTCTSFAGNPVPGNPAGAVLGTADDGAVLADDNGQPNPEGGEGRSAS